MKASQSSREVGIERLDVLDTQAAASTNYLSP